MATIIDLHIATLEFRRAEFLIEEEIRIAQLDGRNARLVELGLSKAIIAMHTGKPLVALRELTLAVSRAARRRIIRPFHDQAEFIAGLVNDTKASSWSFSLNEERAFFAEVCAGLPINSSELHDWAAILDTDQQLVLAPTKREAELLSLMDMGLSNQQIAEYTNLSLATVRWHLKNLYRKFGVSNRAAMLARARARNILPR